MSDFRPAPTGFRTKNGFTQSTGVCEARDGEVGAMPDHDDTPPCPGIHATGQHGGCICYVKGSHEIGQTVGAEAERARIADVLDGEAHAAGQRDATAGLERGLRYAADLVRSMTARGGGGQ